MRWDDPFGCQLVPTAGHTPPPGGHCLQAASPSPPDLSLICSIYLIPGRLGPSQAPLVLTPVIPQRHLWPDCLAPLYILSLTSSSRACLRPPATSVVIGWCSSTRRDSILICMCILHLLSPPDRDHFPLALSVSATVPSVTPPSGPCLISPLVFSTPGFRSSFTTRKCSRSKTYLTYFADLMTNFLALWLAAARLFASWNPVDPSSRPCTHASLSASMLGYRPGHPIFINNGASFSSSTAKHFLN